MDVVWWLSFEVFAEMPDDAAVSSSASGILLLFLSLLLPTRDG